MRVGFGVNEMSEQPLHIVHVALSTTFAGVERYVVDVSNALVERGHRVSIIGAEAAFGGVRTDLRPAFIRSDGLAHAVKAVAALRRSADVLHTHMTSAETAAVLSWPMCRAPVITTRHFAQRRGSSIGGRAVAPAVRRRVRRQLAISRFVADAIGEPCDVLHNGVPDAEPVVPLSHVVLMAQRLENEKHTQDALSAWRASRLGEEGWRLQIAGQGSQRASLKRIAAKHDLIGVEFLGQRADLAALRADSAVLLATAPLEPFGLSVVEAMAAGLPVVAADGGAHRETVGACEPSLLYPPGDTDACARILRRLADDVATRCAIGARLRDYQQAHLRLADHVDQLERIYREVTS